MIHVLLCLTLIASDSEKESYWPSFRNGGSSICTTGRLPVEWSPKKGITWQRELPGYGQSSPVIWGRSAYILSVQGLMKEKCVITALDLQTGKIRWTKSWDSSTQAPSNYRVSRAAPTPVVDGAGVYAFFESGDLIALSHEGKLLWKRSLTKEYSPFQNHHGFGSSPAQDARSMFVNVEHRGPSYLLAIDKATGKNRWKVERKSGMSWSSPIVMDGGQVLVSSNGTATSYDSKSGKVRWSLGGLGGNSKVSPTASGSSLFVAAEVSEFGAVADAARSNLCLQLDGKTDKGYTVLWRARRAVCHYASPLAYKQCVYYVNQHGIVHCLDQKTGKPHYVERLRIPCWATPIAAGEYVYFFGTDGTTKVVKAGPVFELISTNRLWDLDNPPKPETYLEPKSSGVRRRVRVTPSASF